MNIPVIIGVLIAVAIIAAIGVMAYDAWRPAEAAGPTAKPAGERPGPPLAPPNPPGGETLPPSQPAKPAATEGTTPPHARM